MLRFILLAFLTAFVATASVFAHLEKDTPATGVEIGTLFGLSRFPSEGVTSIGVPVGIGALGTYGYPSLYVLWFPSDQLAIGPEFSFGWRSSDGAGFSSLYLAGRGAFFLQSNAVSGPYLLGNGVLAGLYFEGFSEHAFSVGAGLGYQWRVGPAFVLKAEGRYRRWFHEFNKFDEGLNDFSLLFGLGTRLGGR